MNILFFNGDISSRNYAFSVTRKNSNHKNLKDAKINILFLNIKNQKKIIPSFQLNMHVHTDLTDHFYHYFFLFICLFFEDF